MERELEIVTNWAVRERNSLLSGENVRSLPLVCEFDGMGGTGKSRLIAELGSHHYHNYSDPLTFNESNQGVPNVSRNQPKKFADAQFELTCERLDTAHSPENVCAFVFFDRGIFDFILLYNILFNNQVISEEECRNRIRDVMTKGDGRVDLVFVLINSIEESLQGKTVINSLAFMNSLGLKSRGIEETYSRFIYAQEVYRRFFIKSDKVRSCVKQLIDIDVKDAQRDFDRIFSQVITTINLHLLFKAWESLFLTRFGEELKSPQADTKAKILAFAKKLQNSFVHLREKVVKSQEIDPESNVGKTLKNYQQTEFVIGRCGNVKVTMKDIFDSPPTYQVYGLL